MPLTPFPEQDLAKLVLGYLAEQQLMTIYDEFLQASPYLDAVKNEYDRIFMTSLRTILAEYRAAKIYLETCKPFSLRKKLAQCTNLLEVLKLLIRLVDTQKLCAHDSYNKNSFSSHTKDISVQFKHNVCNICKTGKSNTCVCKGRSSLQNLNSTVESGFENEHENLQGLPESTSNNNARNPKVCTNNECSTPLSKYPSYETEEININQYQNQISSTGSYGTDASTKNYDVAAFCDTAKQYDKSIGTLGTCEQIKNTNEPLSICTLSNPAVNTMNVGHSDNTTETFQEFATGVQGSSNYNPINVPSVTTSEIKATITSYSGTYNQKDSPYSFNMLARTQPNTLLLQFASVKNNDKHIVDNETSQQLDLTSKKINDNAPLSNNSNDSLTPKLEEHKVTILSNVRVEQNAKQKTSSKSRCSMDRSLKKVPPVLRNVGSSMEPPTIYVNGTPAYVPGKNSKPQRLFTKDEIMAMPTIILVPVSGVPANASSATTISTITTNATRTLPSQMPLKIDVPTCYSNKQNKKPTITIEPLENEGNLQKDKSKAKAKDTIVYGANNTEPKDATVSLLGKTSTPHVPCQAKKSSSTPRRTSHIRVLDFTTPRQTQDTESLTENKTLVIRDTDVQNLPILETINQKDDEDKVEGNENTVEKESSSKSTNHEKNNNCNVLPPTKTYNWDAQLRALAVPNEPQKIQTPKTKPKNIKIKKTQENEPDKNKNTPKNTNNKTEDKKKSTRKNKTQSVKKKKGNIDEVKDSSIRIQSETVEIPVKPTINVITDWKTAPVPTEKNDNAISGNTDATPEMDRTALQTEFGTKLNISDFLETPYKQALYDIQMETPRFLGPDIPGEPISDIKIMNFPTPKFLSTPGFAVTPKPMQATPSSYTSRPTDYSSGGSYYKPDDQDYMHVLDDAGNPKMSPVTEKHDTQAASTATKTQPVENENLKTNRSLRPVRRCTKNISYYDSPNSTVKKKPPAIETEAVSTCSDMSCSTNCSCDNISSDKKYKTSTTSKQQTDSIQNEILKSKSGKKKSKKKKSPVKKSRTPKLNSFVKIKPRRPTPVKNAKMKKKEPTVAQNESSSKNLPTSQRKRTTSKDKLAIMALHLASVPTKSRRKSSTPRKIHCTKEFNSDSSNNISPNVDTKNTVIIVNVPEKSLDLCSEDNDIPRLHWSDDGSQESKLVDPSANTDDLRKIKEYIVNTEGKSKTNIDSNKENEDNSGSLHSNLVKRGFDIETAKSIERDLLDKSLQVQVPDKKDSNVIDASKSTEENSESDKDTGGAKEIKSEVKSKTDIYVGESDSSGNALRIELEEELDDCVEFTVSESNIDSNNYFQTEHDESKNESSYPHIKLKDKYCMEVCIDDGFTIRLKPTNFTLLLSEDGMDIDKHNDSLICDEIEETEVAVTSITNIGKLYTPLKNSTSIESKCLEIFDSTLTSLDTPIKPNEKQITNIKFSEVTLEVEPIIESSGSKSNATKKRKRNTDTGSEGLLNDSKKNKTESQYLANIQNFDIESVLSKLHGS